MKFKEKIHEIIFEADTPEGKAFDLILLAAIISSFVAVMLESMEEVRLVYGDALTRFEWGITILFTIEYCFRLYSVERPIRYATSFFGIIDLLSIIPTYLSLLIPGAQTLIVVRVLRILRVFRILKLARYVGEAHLLMSALNASKTKIFVFLFGVLSIVIIIGSLMHLVEGPKNNFVDIPTSMYWAVVTLTTVGYGDIVPATAIGRILASVVMILGYAIIAVPTGIVTVEMGKASSRVSTTACPDCGRSDHTIDSHFCRRCGAKLIPAADADESPEA